MQTKTNSPEVITLTQWGRSIALLPLALVPGFLMSPTDYGAYLSRFQFLTTYSFCVAWSAYQLKRDTSELDQGSFNPKVRRQLTKSQKFWLVFRTLLLDTFMMILLAERLSTSHEDAAILIWQALACLWGATLAGWFFPVIDVAVYANNLCPYLANVPWAKPITDATAQLLDWAMSGNWVGATLPALTIILALVRIRVAYNKTHFWVIPRFGFFGLSIGFSLLITQGVITLPDVVGTSGLLLKMMMTVTTNIMIMYYAYLSNEAIVVRQGHRRRYSIWKLASIYSGYASVALVLGLFVSGGHWDGHLFALSFMGLMASNALCLGTVQLFASNRAPRVWRRLYPRMEPVFDDGGSAIISKIVILLLQGLL